MVGPIVCPIVVQQIHDGPTMGQQWANNRKAFTFMEMMLTVALFFLLAGVGVGAYFKYYVFSLASIDVNKAMTHIKQARFRALKNPDNSNYGVHLDANIQTLTTFKNTYNPVDPQNIALTLKQLQITDLNLNPNPGVTNDIIFEKQTGKTQNTGDFTIENDVYSYTFTINSQGVVN